MADQLEYKMNYQNFVSFVFLDFLHTPSNDIIELAFLMYDHVLHRITHRNLTFLKNNNILTPQTQSQTLIRTSDLQRAPSFQQYLQSTLEPLILNSQKQYTQKKIIVVFQNQIKRNVFLQAYSEQIGPLPSQWHMHCYFNEILEINPDSAYKGNQNLRKYADSVHLKIKYTQPENIESAIDDLSRSFVINLLDIMYAVFSKLIKTVKPVELVLFRYNPPQDEERKTDNSNKLRYLIICDLSDRKGFVSFFALAYEIESRSVVTEFQYEESESRKEERGGVQQFGKEVSQFLKSLKEPYQFVCFNRNHFEQIISNQFGIRNIAVPTAMKNAISLSSVYTEKYQKQLSINQMLQDLKLKVEEQHNVRKCLEIVVKLQSEGLNWNKYVEA